MIYLDNAATSWPKPPETIDAMKNCLESVGGNPGRSGHRASAAAARMVYEVRETVCTFFNSTDPMKIFFTHNGTHALNYVLMGMLKEGDQVLTTSVEHNAVMRPLRELEKQKVVLHRAACRQDGSLDLDDFSSMISPSITLAVVTHASNVLGTITPIAKIADLCRKHGVLLLVDAAQTAGALPIDMQDMGIDLLACTGHKGLLGPPGTGFLAAGPRADLELIKPIIRGGTGSRSKEEYQPMDLPDKYESGTPNSVGLAGLYGGMQWLTRRGMDAVRAHEMKLAARLIEGLQSIQGITVHGTRNPEQSVAVVSFSCRGKTVSDIGLMLDERHGILSRVGLHCAPSAHRTAGTFPEGTVRLSPGCFTTADEIERTIEAVREVVHS